MFQHKETVSVQEVVTTNYSDMIIIHAVLYMYQIIIL